MTTRTKPARSEETGYKDNQRRALRGFLGILTGSSIAQLLAVAAIPLISRLYSPEDAAHYAMLLAVGVVLASVAGLRLDLAIPIPDGIPDSHRLFWLAVAAPLVVLPVALGCVLLLRLLGAPILPDVTGIDFLAISIFVLLVSSYAAATQLAVRLQAYGPLARIPPVQMAGTLAAQVALGLLGSSKGLFIGALFGRSLGIVGLLRAGGVTRSQVPNRAQSRALLKRFWRFPVIFAPASLVNVLGANLAAMMLPAMLGLGPAGLYAMAVRVAAVPAAVLSESAGQVFVGEFARARNRWASVRVFFRWSVRLLVLALLVLTAIWFLSPVVLPGLLGPGWEGTAELAQYAGIIAGASIVAAPLQDVWRIRQRGLMLITWNVIRLMTTGGIIWWGASAGWSIAQLALALSLTTAAVYALSWLGCLVAALRPPAGSDEVLSDGVDEAILHLESRDAGSTA